jgi:hypothetical protein
MRETREELARSCLASDFVTLDYKALNSAGFSPRSRRKDGGKLTHRFLIRSKAIPDIFPE